MALPSQIQSSPLRGRHVYRRRRRRRGPVVMVGLVAIGAVAWLAWSWGYDSTLDSGGDRASSEPQAEIQNQAVATTRTSGSSAVFEMTPTRTDQPQRTSTRNATLPVTPLGTSPVITPASPAADSLPRWTPDSAQVNRETQPSPSEETSAGDAGIDTSVSTTFASGPLRQAQGLISDGRLVEARATLSQALDQHQLTSDQATDAKVMLGHLNDELVYGPRVYPGDPWAEKYVVQSGDSLSGIVSRQRLQVDWRLLQYINGLDRPEQIQLGQTLKIIRGPFHAEINKKTHQLDLYLGAGPDRTFVRSYAVGLGAMNSTPLGRFQVQKGRKLVNPTWTNPRTGEFYPADDPENPIGEYWVGLKGLDPANIDERGFGIHGTIEPESIGTNSSMGCVRLRDGEIDMIYAVLAEGASTIDVRE
jgi:LysM repeat protein